MKNKNVKQKTSSFLRKKYFFLEFIIFLTGFIFFPTNVCSQSYDYADLLGKTLFFVEANACGAKPSTSTVSWRNNCHMNDGGGSLVGGFHDAGDHVKFNYPMALPMYTLALSYLDYTEQYQRTGNEQRILGILRHAGEYMIRCHTAPNEYVIQVGLGRTDHQFWQSPEENTYFRDVLKIDNNKPGSDLGGPTAGAMAAISEVFKNIDTNFSNDLLTHARQLFDFADRKRGPFSNHIPSGERAFYQSQNGSINQIDDLMIGAVWLYRRTGEQIFKIKANQFFEEIKYRATGYAPSFGDHQYQAHMIMSQITGDPRYINGSVRGHINNVLNQYYTPGGLWIFRAGHNEFNSYQTVGNAYLAYALAEFVGSEDSKYREYKNYAINQIEYLSGKNPRNSSYIGGFGPNYPRRIHHRAANNDTTLRSGAPDDQYVLNGALVSGPDSNDNYSNDRTNHRQTEPTLSPNSLLTILAAQMVKEYDLGGEPTPVTEGSIEIENNFTVRNDVGNNSSVGADTFNPGASAGQYVRLFDINDELSTTFTVSEAGEYKLDLRVRVGEQTGTTTNLVDQYEIKVKGLVKNFTLVNSTISELDKDTYWGELTYTTNEIGIGTHTVIIKAKSNWLKADRLNFEKVDVTNPSIEDEIISIDVPFSVTSGETVNTLVNYSASSNRDVFVNFQLDGEPDFSTVVSVRVPVVKGIGTLNIPITIPENTPLGTDQYRFTIHIGPTGTFWDDRLDFKYQGDIDVVSNSNNPSSDCDILVRAAGQTGEEIIRLLIDDQFVYEWSITDTFLSDYTTTVSTGGNIKIQFVNDGPSSNGVNKNVRIDKITFAGTTIESEDAIITGSGTEEWLWANGNFDYGNLDCVSFRNNIIRKELKSVSELINIYPNPTSNNRIVNVQNVLSDVIYQIELYNLTGRKVLSKSNISKNSSISLENFTPGLYILKFIDTSTLKTARILKLIIR
ncbi:glycoside hydrolase family 9 protein [uncultured Aquimarina sp.]|uniref:glycoside hydrolase family 9 protein n=1 Tax=uncultured Aquimarina sp. TaxID=575652 RepID=UPI00261D3A38|nr:glycoside hydrolase family 9 protein [uncultured Aquimarina sp.]